jgi:hypothetical protein
MKFNPGRDNDPFQYKGYEAWIRRADNEWLTSDAIEIRLVRRHVDRSKTMIIRFLIKDRHSLFKCLHHAIKALKKAELEEQTNV